MKEINTVNQKSLPERTADAIVAMLHMENYKAGAKLPNEIQMAQRFDRAGWTKNYRKPDSSDPR